MKNCIHHVMRSLVCLLAVMAVAGCTRNNGDIGPLFGRWQLDSMKVDGEAQTIYDEDVLLYVWAFQGNIVEIQTIYPHQSWERAFGIWNYTDNGIALDFTYKDNYGEEEYTPPVALGLPRGVTTLTFASRSGSEMSLWWIDAGGVKYEYTLTKMY